MAKKKLNEVAVGLIVAVAGSLLLLAFYLFNLDMRWIIAFIVGIVGLIVYQQITDKRTFLLYCLIFMLPFTGGFMYSELTKTDLIFAFDMILFVLVGWWILETHGFQSGKLYVHASTTPGFLMVVWAALGTLFAVSRLGTVHGVFFLAKSFMFYFFVINRILTLRRLKVIINMLMLGLGIQAVMGLLQRILSRYLGFEFFGERVMAYTGELSRVSGTLGFPNQYGAYIILLLPLAISFYIQSHNKKEKQLYGLLIVLTFFALFFSLSRSSWFGTFGSIIVMMTILAKRKKLNPKLLKGVLVVTLMIIIIAVIFWDLILYRFEKGERGEWRTLMITIAFPIILSHPLLGVGLFNYQYHSFSSFEFWHPVHNEYLRIAAEMGIPGLFFFLWFIVVIYKQAYRNLNLKNSYLSKVNLGVIGGYTAFLIAVIFGPEYQHYRQKFIFWLLAAISVASTRIAKREMMMRKRMMNKNEKPIVPNLNYREKAADHSQENFNQSFKLPKNTD